MFSFGIPVFKGKFFEDCLSSVLNQTYTDIEIIIVNDDSPDDIDSIIYKLTDKRIKYFKNKKRIGVENVVVNWNACLEKASGEYFNLLCDDDFLLPNFAEEFLKLAQKYPNQSVYHCRSYIINENGFKKDLTKSRPELETVYESIYHRLTKTRSQYLSDFVFKTSFLKKAGGYFKTPAGWLSDDITSYLVGIENGIAHTQTPVFCYRENSISLTNSGSIKLKLEGIKIYEKWLKDFLKKIPSNENDKIFHSNILQKLKKQLSKNKIDLLARSFKKDTFSFFSFFLNKNKLNCSSKELIIGLIKGLKNKYFEKL